MAAQILKDEKKTTDFPVVPVPASDCAYAFSSTNLAANSLTMPEAMQTGHEWKDINA